jgi:hypothetical protein
MFFLICVQRYYIFLKFQRKCLSLHRQYEKTTQQITGILLLCPALGDVNIPHVGTLCLLRYDVLSVVSSGWLSHQDSAPEHYDGIP